MTTFIVNGLLHVHVTYVAFHNRSSLLPAFMFFFLHSIACYLEANLKLQLSAYMRWLGTHVFLLITAPLMLEPFIKEGSTFFIHYWPLFLNVEWIPRLLVPSFCFQ